MELGSTVRAGLSACTAAPLSPSALADLLRTCFSALCAGESREAMFDSEELSSLNRGTLKLCHFGLMGLILEAARHAMEPTELGELLDEYKFSTECKRVFTSAYQTHFEKLTDVLHALSPSSPVLTDVSWRLGYSIRNNFLHRVDQLNYEITFHSENTMLPASKDVSFNCSPEQLQDLIAKLKDAMKSIEKAGQA
uniref:COMM domain-containing protein 3 isoform X2 n=1 Tax=Myxine glutinosa TaxID=7769 RepID=UPI0035900E37